MVDIDWRKIAETQQNQNYLELQEIAALDEAIASNVTALGPVTSPEPVQAPPPPAPPSIPQSPTSSPELDPTPTPAPPAPLPALAQAPTPTPEITGPSIGPAPELTDEDRQVQLDRSLEMLKENTDPSADLAFIDAGEYRRNEEYRNRVDEIRQEKYGFEPTKFVKKEGEEFAPEEATTALEQLGGGFLRPFEQTTRGLMKLAGMGLEGAGAEDVGAAVQDVAGDVDDPSRLGAFQVPEEGLTTPQAVTRGLGQLGGIVAEFAGAGKAVKAGLKGVGKGGLDIAAKTVAKKGGHNLATREGKRAFQKQLRQELIRQGVRKEALEDAITFGTLEAVKSEGDPIDTALGAVLGGAFPFAVSGLKPVAKEALGRTTTTVKRELPKAKQFVEKQIDRLALNDSLKNMARTLRSERGAIDEDVLIPGQKVAKAADDAVPPGEVPGAPGVKPTDPKERGFVTTLKESERTAEQVKEGLSGTYTPITNKATFDSAKKLVDENFDEAVRIVKAEGPPTAETNTMGQILIDRLQREGKFQQAIDIAEVMAEKATSQGQAIQALSIWNRLSPEGILRYSARQLDKARGKAGKGTMENLGSKTKAVKEGLNEVNKKAAQQVGDKLQRAVHGRGPMAVEDVLVSGAGKPPKTLRPGVPERVHAEGEFIDPNLFLKKPVKPRVLKEGQRLREGEGPLLFEKALTPVAKETTPEATKRGALIGKKGVEEQVKTIDELAEALTKKIEGDFKPAVEKEAKDEILVTLHKFAREFYKKPPKTPTTRNQALEQVAQVLKDRDRFRSVFGKARDILLEKHKDNPAMSEALNRIFGVGGATPFGEGQLNRAVLQQLRDSGVNLKDVVVKHYSEVDVVGKDLAQKLTEIAGLTPGQAKELELFISNEFKSITQDKKQQLLKQIFKERIISPRKEISQKIIELSNLGAFTDTQYKELVAKKLGLPALSDDLAQKLFTKAESLQQLPAMSEERIVGTAELLKMISDEIPSTLGQKIATFQTMAQLLNPKTAIRNIVGNLGFGAVEAGVTQPVAAGVDKAISLFTGQRAVVMPNIRVFGEGFIKGGKEGFRDAMKGIDTMAMSTKFDIPRMGVFKGRIGKSLETLLNLELRAPDRAFYRASYELSLDNQLRAAAKSGQKLAEPTQKMLEIAHHDALYKTFQDESIPAKIFSGLKKTLNVGKDFGLGDLTIKYPKTPGNLLSRGIQYSPLGFLNLIGQMVKPLITKGEKITQKEVSEGISRALVGSVGMVGSGALMHRLGLVFSPDDDPDLRSIKQEFGLGGYRINTTGLKRFFMSGGNPDEAKLQKGDNVITFDWFQPHAIPFAMGADIDKSGGLDVMGAAGATAEGLKAGVDSLAEQSVISGLTRALKKRRASEVFVAMIEGTPSSFVPSILGQIRILTGQPRETYDPDTFKKAMNRAIARVPVLEKTLPERYSTLGKERKFFEDDTGLLEKLVDTFINPAWQTEYEPTEESELLLDLHSLTGEVKQFPRRVKRQQTLNGVQINLTGREIQDLQQYTGNMVSVMLKDALQNKGFIEMSPDAQVDYISKQLTKIGKVAKIRVLKDKFIQTSGDDDLAVALIRQDVDDVEMQQEAELYYEKLKSMDKTEANRLTRELQKSDKDLFKRLKQLRSDDLKDVTLDDRRLLKLGVSNGNRVQYIWKMLQDIDDDESRNALFRELKDKKIISKKVEKQLRQIKAKGGLDGD